MTKSLGIVYNKNKKEIIENLGQRLSWPSSTELSNKYDIRAEFIDIYKTKDLEIIGRINDGDSFNLNYEFNQTVELDAVYEYNENNEQIKVTSGTLYDVYDATGFDFSPEESKNWLKIEIVRLSGDRPDSPEINLGDVVNVRIESWTPDLSGIDTTDNTAIKSKVVNPEGYIPIRIGLTSGVCNAEHQFSIPGIYQFPAKNIRIDGYRLYEYKEVDVCMEW